MPTPIVPGSIIKHDGSDMTIADDGEGNCFTTARRLHRSTMRPGKLRAMTQVPCRCSRSPSPAVAIAQSTLSYHSLSASARAVLFTWPHYPHACAGTLSVSYRANGRWYTLMDDGTGALVNETAGIGVGLINYATGTVNVTAGALPDIGSSVIYAWARQAVYEICTSDIAAQVPEVSLTLAEGNCEPSTVSVSWSRTA